jgi:hypothetical protein
MINEIIMNKSIYIDTSVFGGYFDDEFEVDTQLLFKKIFKENITIIIADTVSKELVNAPDDVKDFFDSIPKEIIKEIPLTDEIKILANKYIEANVITKKNISDCYQIATATIVNADIIVSWNFKHFVNSERKKGYNAVNISENYKTINILSPTDVINYGNQ